MSGGDLLERVRRELFATQARLDELRVTERVLAGLSDEAQPISETPADDAKPLAVRVEPDAKRAAEPKQAKPKRVVVLWTDEEEAILRNHWPDAEACVPLLNGRSLSAIKYHGYMMRLHHDQAPQWPQNLVVDEPLADEPERKVPLGDRRFKENRSRTFDEQLEAVRNGAPIVEQRPIRRSDPVGTLGGVVGEIL